MRVKSIAWAALCLGLVQAHAVPPAAAEGSQANPSRERRIWMTVGERRFSVALADNEAARAFATQLPLALDMPDLNGNEKHASLPRPLPVDAAKPGTIREGDVLLYGDDTLVIFYKTFPSSYSYTRIGRIEQSAGLAQALGPGSQRITFALR